MVMWDEAGWAAVFLPVIFQLGCIGMLAWTLNLPGRNHFRLRFGVLHDLAILVFYMTELGAAGAQIVAICWFSALVYLSPFCRQKVAPDAGIFALLIALPAYVSVLIERLH